MQVIDVDVPVHVDLDLTNTKTIDLTGDDDIQEVSPTRQPPAKATPVESLVYTYDTIYALVAPVSGTSINNDWLPELHVPAVKFYEFCGTFFQLSFVDNLLGQFIVPNVQKAVAD
ncbi:hypothetical protein DXG01_002584 [Tephrocybe rancida]|nr:hypothetical protein DXG01_002584 [Tephrocybe rancida]